jgi:hypothetical protein
MLARSGDISPEAGAEPRTGMSNPLPYLVRMLLFLFAVAGVAYVLQDDLVRVYLNTPTLNAVIMGVLAIGIFFVFRQVIILWPEVKWLRRFQHREEGSPPPPTDSLNLLAPMAAMLRERQDEIRLSPTATRALLDGIAIRLDERRELARYMIGLLIFLGLLGTFWGLLQTIGAVADAINGLQVGTGDSMQMFSRLKGSIEGPLKGMSTAFGASLFGLSGSLVLGFLELQASQAQGRFHIELEEWLARATSITRPMAGAAPVLPAYVEALLERNAEGTDALLRALQRVEESRQSAATANAALLERLASLAESVREQQNLLARFTELSLDLRSAVARAADRSGNEADREAGRAHQRNVEAHLSRLVEESTRHRAALADELRLLAGRVAERSAHEAGREADREAILVEQRNLQAQVARVADETTRARNELIAELRGLAGRVADRSAASADRDALIEQQRSLENQIVRLSDESLRLRADLTEDLRGIVGRLQERAASPGDGEALALQQRNIETLLARVGEETAGMRSQLSGELQQAVSRLGDGSIANAAGESLAAHQRNIEAHLAHLVEENSRGRAALLEELRSALGRLSDRIAGSDREALAAHQRTIEAQLARLGEETALGRTALSNDLRGEIRLLARTLALGGREPGLSSPVSAEMSASARTEGE